jgi:hypothetical protein
MAAFCKFDCFVGDVGLKLHQLNTDTLKVYLTNEQPLVTDTVYDNPLDLATLGGYTAGGADVQNTYSVVGSGPGVGTLVGVDYEWTATAAGIGPFRWAVLYNETAAAKNLIGWWQYASEITLAEGEKFKVDFGASILTVT